MIDWFVDYLIEDGMEMEKSNHHLHDDLKRERERYVIPVKSGKNSLVMDRSCGMNQRRLVQTHSEEIEREKPRDRSFRARRADGDTGDQSHTQSGFETRIHSGEN